jgi:hypothetical protein
MAENNPSPPLSAPRVIYTQTAIVAGIEVAKEGLSRSDCRDRNRNDAPWL